MKKPRRKRGWGACAGIRRVRLPRNLPTRDADRRNFYKKWDEAEVHVEALINASNDWRVQKLSSPPKRRADHAVAFLAALIAKKESPGAKTGPWWGRNDRAT